MFAQQIQDDWNELHLQQFDWALRAYARLIKTLSHDIQEKLNTKEEKAEPYIAVFGKTQVGKTTLLLDLMGIDPNYMTTISQVLRGGQNQGKSATATTMEYRPSVNHQWGLSIQSKSECFDGDDKMTCALRKLREQMESGNLIVDTPCIVHIPKQFFTNTLGSKVRILDLPGDNPANEQEQKHVNLMAQTYLPFADLILLVGKIDDLGFLRPEVITLPSIEDWQTMPHRFRVVTTYSYTAKSVKDDLQKSANVDVNMMRQRLIKQIETFGTISQDVSLYFPMEFGDTLAKLKDNNPTLHEKILPIITQLRKELHTQITTATTPMGRVRRTLNTHQIVEHTTKKKIEENRIERDQLIKKKEKLESELDIWRKEKEKMEKKAQKIDELLKRHTLENSLSLIQQAADQLRYTRPKINKTEGVNGLKEFISNCYQMLYSMRLDVEPKYEETNSLGETDTYWIEVRRNIKEFDDNIVQGILNNAFGSTHSILNTYSIDTYFFEGRYKKDHDHAVNAFEIAKKNLKDAWIEAWITALKITDSKYKDRQKDAHSECTISQYEYEKSAQELKKTELRIITNQDKEERIKHRSAEDMKRCHSFVDLLDEEYLEELKQRMKSVYETKDDSDSLIQLLSFVELKNQREELMALNANLMN